MTLKKGKPKDYSGPLSFHREGHIENNPSESHIMATFYNLGDTEMWCEIHRPGWMLRARCTDDGYHMICRNMDKDQEYRFGPDGLPKKDILNNFLAFRSQQNWSEKLLTIPKADSTRSDVQINDRTFAKPTQSQSNSSMNWPSVDTNSYAGKTKFARANPKMICQHCQTRGGVQTRQINKKRGISGGKATAGFLTLGLSLFVVGLARKENVTEAHCLNCNATWHF